MLGQRPSGEVLELEPPEVVEEGFETEEPRDLVLKRFLAFSRKGMVGVWVLRGSDEVRLVAGVAASLA